MESLHSQDELSDHATVMCPHSGCSLHVIRRELDEHILLCHSSLPSSRSGQVLSDACSHECPKGCGIQLTANADREHNCISELRTTIEILRAEMICRMENQKREMEAMLDMQRGQMLRKETALRDQIQGLKTELGQLGDRLKKLLDVEMERKKELDRLTTERAEIMALLNNVQKEKQEVVSLCQNCLLGGKGKVTNV